MSKRLTMVMLLAVSLAACAGLLGIRHESTSRPFEHREHILKGINCVECHVGVDVAGEGGSLHFPPDATCRGCHQKPHDERSCQGCHGEPYVRQAVELARTQLRFTHSSHILAAKGDCVHCHGEVTETRPDAVLPKMATCFGCHEHRDEWTLRSCDGCHVDLVAESTPPDDHIVHDGDWIREHGTRAASARDLCATCHSERECASCHGVGTVPVLPARLAFDDARLPGLHRAGFAARHSDEARADPGLCTTCHTESSCIDCHTRENVAPGTTTRSPHPPGWLTTSGGDHGPQARMDPTSCAGCHGGAGEQLCIGCHRVGGPGGNPHGPGFASARDEHRDLPCRLCHGVGP
jgi:hypothetical protein